MTMKVGLALANNEEGDGEGNPNKQGIMNEYLYRWLSMLKSTILSYFRKTGKDPEPGEPKC